MLSILHGINTSNKRESVFHRSGTGIITVSTEKALPNAQRRK
jgi:hypothetical protein